jgi:hypothetical protein
LRPPLYQPPEENTINSERIKQHQLRRLSGFFEVTPHSFSRLNRGVSVQAGQKSGLAGVRIRCGRRQAANRAAADRVEGLAVYQQIGIHS